MCGANDYTNNITDLSSYNSILSYVSAAQATGFSVIVLTPTSRIGGPNTNGQTGDQFVQALSVRIRNGAVANGYTVADVNADPVMGCTGCYSNLTYFDSGGLHPTQTGLNVIAGYLTTALLSVGFH